MPKTSYKHYRRRTGDRSDGRLLRSLSGFELFIPYVMAQRNDALNFFSENVEITEADRWLRKQRVNGYKGMGFLHVLIAAYIRAVAKYPAMNRFISGRHYYARNDIEVVMTVKVGDKVITSKYAGTEVKADGVEYNIVRQSDILAIVE